MSRYLHLPAGCDGDGDDDDDDTGPMGLHTKDQRLAMEMEGSLGGLSLLRHPPTGDPRTISISIYPHAHPPIHTIVSKTH